MIAITAATLMRIRRVRRVTVASSELRAARWTWGGSDARRPFGALAGGVGADRGPGDHEGGVDRHLGAGDRDDEVVETARRRATLLLADPAVLRSVAGAL